MGTLSDGGRITLDLVNDEIERLKHKWQGAPEPDTSPTALIEPLLGAERCSGIDVYDQIMLSGIVKVCQESNSMAEAGRKLFNVSRDIKKSSNDSHRVKQLLNK